jgi:uncharacterized protein (DUF433 family)
MPAPFKHTSIYSIIFREMKLEWQKYIYADPKIMMGKPVFVGTRIPVDLVFEKIAAGESVDQILEAHPRLTREAVLAAFAFASDWLRSETIYPVPQPA